MKKSLLEPLLCLYAFTRALTIQRGTVPILKGLLPRTERRQCLLSRVVASNIMVTGDISWSVIEIKMDLDSDYKFKMSQFKPLIKTKLVHSSPLIYRAQVLTSITVLKIRQGKDTWFLLKLRSTRAKLNTNSLNCGR